jgi:hypothetical protein
MGPDHVISALLNPLVKGRLHLKRKIYKTVAPCVNDQTNSKEQS